MGKCLNVTDLMGYESVYRQRLSNINFSLGFKKRKENKKSSFV